jgi:hypothetical protein
MYFKMGFSGRAANPAEMLYSDLLPILLDRPLVSRTAVASPDHALA